MILERAPGRTRLAAARRRRAIGWASWSPAVVAAALLWCASRRDWGAGGELVPYLGAAIAFLGVLPALRWGARRARGANDAGRVPFFPVLGVLYALYFGAPVLWRDEYIVASLRWTPAIVERAQWIALGGWVALAIGWKLASRWLRNVAPQDLELDWTRARAALPWLLGAGFLATVVVRVLDLPAGFVQPMRFLQTLFQAGLALLMLLHYRGELSRRVKLVLWFALVPGYLFLQVGHGSVAQLAYAGIFLMFVAWGVGRRVPVLALAAGVLAILVMRGHVQDFRREAWSETGSAAEAGMWDRSVLFVDMLVTKFTKEPERAFDRSVEVVSSRLSHSATLAHVVALTPSAVPHWNGATYAALPTTLVPRALWPDKPSKEIGQAFGHRYALIARHDRTTSVNLPIVVEFFANFGVLGVLLGMAALGGLYFLLHRLWNTPGTGEGTLVLGCILFSRLILIESDFTLVFGGVLQNAVLLVVLFRCLGPRRERKSRARERLARCRSLG